MAEFNPVAALLQADNARTQISDNAEQRTVNELQGRLSQQGGGAFNPINQQLGALSNNPIEAFGRLDVTRQNALIQDAKQAARMIRAGEPGTALEIAQDRLSELQQIDPNADTSDTAFAVQGIQQGMQTGNFDNILQSLDSVAGIDIERLKQKQRGTSAGKDFNTFQDLLKVAQSSGLDADRKRAEQFGRRANFIRPTEQQSADIKVDAAERKEVNKSNTKRKQGFIDAGVDAADSTSNVRRSLDLLKTIKTGGFANASLNIKRFFGVEGADEGELSANLGRSVLAQLKPIFGAAFTAQEGERLEKIEARFGSSSESNVRLLEQVLKISERASRRGIAAAEAQGDQFTANEIKNALSFKIENKIINDTLSPQEQSELEALELEFGGQ